MQRFNAPASPSGRLRAASEQGLLDASRSLEMALQAWGRGRTLDMAHFVPGAAPAALFVCDLVPLRYPGKFKGPLGPLEGQKSGQSAGCAAVPDELRQVWDLGLVWDGEP